MRIVISPYHLTTREVPAMASLLLADGVVTMTPAPLTEFGPADLHRAVERSARYRAFMESWAWTLPLWRAGVIASSIDGHDPTPEVHHAWSLIDSDDELAPLRPLMRRALFDDDRDYLDALAGDLLRGGPDPGISIPMAAGLDRFAARHGLMVARSEATSVAQKAEARLGQRAMAFAVPVLTQAGAAGILGAREVLARPLAALRRALGGATEAAMHTADGTPDADSTGAVQRAAADYAEAFEREHEGFASADDEPRAVRGFVAVTAALLPGDAVLRSSVAAARTLGLAGREPRGAPSALPVLSDPLRVGRVVSLTIRTMGRPR